MKKIMMTTIIALLLSTSGWAENLPKMIDLGADKCVPCIEMAPMLKKLTKDFDGKMDVQFIDVWKDSDEAAKYGVRMIPTQIFYAPDGSELFRHIGFYSRTEILTKWKDLGYDFGATD
jgi:thioredoxin